MQNNNVITIVAGKKAVTIPSNSILYIIMDGNIALVHLTNGEVIQSRTPLYDIEVLLDDSFIKVKRGCIVSVIAIYNLTDKVNLINGEELDYAMRHKKEIIKKFRSRQAQIIHRFNEASAFASNDDYLKHYSLFDSLPIAFCDIEMIFDNEFNAVDWVFRYANNALAELEKVPLSRLIGNTFHNLFPNMDLKWLKTYERSALFGETIKIVDYSHEIDTYLDIICFPTFKGHCGCILFDVKKVNSYRKSTDTEKALALFLGRLMQSE